MKYEIITKAGNEPLVRQYANTKEGALLAFQFADAEGLAALVVERPYSVEIKSNL